MGTNNYPDLTLLLLYGLEAQAEEQSRVQSAPDLEKNLDLDPKSPDTDQ